MYSISPLGKVAHFDEISYSGPYTYLSNEMLSRMRISSPRNTTFT